MKGFIIHPTYQTENGKSVVYLFGRLENNKSFLLKQDFRPYFYIKESDKTKAKEILENLDVEKGDFKDFKANKLIKITLDTTSELMRIRDELINEEIECYEADIRFAYRYMFDNGIQGSVDIEGDYEKGERVDRVYTNAKLKPAYFKPKLKILSFDIETDKKADQLYSISFYTDDFKKVVIAKKGENLKNTISVDNEEEAVKKFSEFVKEIDPDIITGWNVIDFDLKILRDKFLKYNIPFKLGRTEWNSKLRIESDFFRDSKADISGRVVLDGINLLKGNFYKLENYKLDTAAQVYLGEKKLIGEKNKGDEIEGLYKNNPQKLVDYNLKDSELVYNILEKTKLIELTIQRSLLTGMPLDRVGASIASLDSLYLRELKKRGIVAYSSKQNVRKRITGGYVMTSKPGIYKYVIVCDFKSLYPSIIKTFNIDPLMFVPVQKKGTDNIIAPNGAQFKRENGILPTIIHRLWKQRDNAKKENNEQASYAIKILMNSFFGVLANPMCRFYSFDMANSITTFAQFFTKSTAELVKKKGYDVIYGDTDSVFINLDVDSYEKAEKIGLEIQDYINKYYKKEIKEKYRLNNFLDLEFEKVYKNFLMPFVRGGTSGAKKRYVGIREFKEANKLETKMEFTGMEFVRRDWTELSKQFQLKLINLIFSEQPIEKYVKEFITKLKKGELDDLLIYKKALRKAAADYVKTTPPHVKAARILEGNNMLGSNLIEYVMTANGPEPIQLRKHSIDYEHYINKQIRPIADSVLVFFNKKLDDILAGGKQASLFDY
ncbi:DNA polymerase II [Candidatus Woesearchaeota archaeon]|nr:DNA polymerase II [Candidatus Woesearchaeota archaeon]